MKKKLLFIPLLFLIVYILSALDLQFPHFTGAAISPKTNSYLQEPGGIQIFFCPHQDCNGALVNFIDSAQESIHCALFELDLPEVQAKLLEKEKQMEVQIVTDDGYLYEFNYDFVKTDRYGLMHNKFCVIDGKKVSTGSMNPTHNDAHKNNNNLLLIESKTLAGNYEDEFQEMWNGTFKKGDKVRNPSVRLGNTTISNYFCPEDQCAARVREELKKAKESIDFMAFSFTHGGIANILLLKNLENVTLRGVMEARQVTKYSKFQVLEYQGIDVVKDGNPQNMHHKVFIIDRKTVVTGSFNPTSGGDERNDENILIIDNKEIAELFVGEFEKVFNEGKEKIKLGASLVLQSPDQY